MQLNRILQIAALSAFIIGRGFPSENCKTSLAVIGENHTQTFSYNNVTFEVRPLKKDSPILLTPHPREAVGYDRSSPIHNDIGTVWDLAKFKKAREPIKISPVREMGTFSKPADVRILDMPIKMAGSINDYRLPRELEQFAPVIL